MAALCKPSSYAEYAPSLQYSNKQKKMFLEKTVSFIGRQEKQVTSSVGINQAILTKRLQANLERSAAIEAKISKIRGRESTNLGSGTPAVEDLKQAWSDGVTVERNSSAQKDALSPNIALPAALRILKSQGKKIAPEVEAKITNLDKNRRFSTRRFSICSTRPNNLKETLMTSRHPVSEAGNKHRRGSAVSSTSSGGLLKKKRPRNQQVMSQVLAPLPPLRPSSAPRGHATDKEFATAMWVAGTTTGKEQHSEHGRPASAKPNIHHDTDETETPPVEIEHPYSSSESEPPAVIDRFPTPPDSPDLSDLRVYEEPLTAKSMEELLAKLNENDPQISLIDLHRAVVASKNYPDKIKQFVRRIYRYKAAEGANNTDYYSSKIHNTNKKS
ncbi:uncharacterized protein LOC100178235 [Ciona intestinalis]